MARIAVVGAGGVGGYFGARLSEAGHEVHVLARGAHLEALRRDGLRLESPAGDVSLRVAAHASAAEVGPVDLVLVCVKAWQVREAARTLHPLLGGDTVVLPLQNGVEAAEELAAELGEEPVLGGLCRLLSFIVAPGHVRHAGVAPSIVAGERTGRGTDRVERVAVLFSGTRGVDFRVSSDIGAALWEKFLFIAPFGGVGAVSRATAAEMREVPETRALLERAMHEVAAVARARGVALREDAVARTLGFVDGLPGDSTASMQRDLLEGRPSELDAQTGAVVRLGRAHGTDVPVHEVLYASLLPGERKARARCDGPSAPSV